MVGVLCVSSVMSQEKQCIYIIHNVEHIYNTVVQQLVINKQYVYLVLNNMHTS